MPRRPRFCEPVHSESVIRFTFVDVELETLSGLEEFARDEVLGMGVARDVRIARAGRVSAIVPFLPEALHHLRSVVAAHVVDDFAVPRPRALLGHEHLARIVETAQSILRMHPPHRFRTLRVSAAGADSAVFELLKHELADALGLDVALSSSRRPSPRGSGSRVGDLLIAVRRAGPGWQVLSRTTPRPLSARAWRVCDFPGALNATVASVMARLTLPQPDETFVNVACGSGTLLIERLALGTAALAVGYDTDEAALACARANIAASGCSPVLAARDATRLPHESGTLRTVVGDLPYAMRLGSGASNAALYPAIVGEAARVLMPGGRLVLVTTQTRLMADTVAADSARLRVERVVSLSVPHEHGAINPRIWVLERL